MSLPACYDQILVRGGWSGRCMPQNIQSKPTAHIGKIDLGLVRRNLNDAQRAIASINYSEVWKRVGTLIKCGNVQIETKKPAHGAGVNLHVHVDDMNSADCSKTMAKISIDEALR